MHTFHMIDSIRPENLIEARDLCSASNDMQSGLYMGTLGMIFLGRRCETFRGCVEWNVCVTTLSPYFFQFVACTGNYFICHAWTTTF